MGPNGKPIGELWLFSDYPTTPTRVSEGPEKGKAVQQLMEEYGKAFWGSARPRSRFPILVKELRSRFPLPLQVHPSRGADMKNECWYIQEVKPSRNWVINGWRAQPPEVIKSLRSDNPYEYLVRQPVTPGMLVTVPAGAPHALGPEMVALEIQDTADVTLRIDLWGHPEWELSLAREQAIEEFATVKETPQVLLNGERTWERESWRVRVVSGDALPIRVKVPTVVIPGDKNPWRIHQNDYTLTMAAGQVALLLPGLTGVVESDLGSRDWVFCEVR